MLRRLKHLWLGLALIAVASGILLWSDLDRRQKQKPVEQRLPRVALFQFTAAALLDDAVRGVVEGLASSGLVDGQTIKLDRFNALGDYATANAIARNIVAGGYDQIITISTPALQVMAAANREAKTQHVFGAVTDPYGSGVNITGTEPDQHPAHLVGIGTFQPVTNLFALAQKMCPQLRRVGVVWSPTEHNSEVCVLKARAFCKAQGLELIEANAGNTSEVPEAIRAVLARDVDAIWIGGDTVAGSSVGAIVATAKASKIPVFTNDPTDVGRGALFSLGASYPDVGRTVADLSARLLRGADARAIGVANVVPERLTLSSGSFTHWKLPWTVSDEIRQRAVSAKVSAGASPASLAIQPTAVQRTVNPPPASPWNVRIVAYNDTSMSEECQMGLKDGLKAGGLVEGRDYHLKVLNAQGDMTTLSSIMSSVRSDKVDLLMVVTTPALQAALRQAGPGSIVFTGVGDAVQAGAGKTETDHLPNVTGITTRSSFEGMAKLVREVLPGARRVGTLFTPSELNSVLYKDWLAEALKPLGIELVAVPVTSTAETAEATTALCRQPIEALCQIADNATRPGFAQIIRKAAEARLPVFAFESGHTKIGAVLALARDYHQAGLEAGEMAVRVLRGERPATIPFANTRGESLTINPGAAAKLGLKFPPRVLKEATIMETTTTTPAKKP